MKSDESSSKLGLLLSVLLIFGGAFLIARPLDGTVVSHPNMVPRGNTQSRFATPTEIATPARSRLYGFGLIVVGLGLGAFSVYRPRG